MAKKSRLKQIDQNILTLHSNTQIIWSEDFSQKLDLTPYFDGLAQGKKALSKFAPFAGQPKLMMNLRNAIKRWCKTNAAYNHIVTYLNGFFKFLDDTNRHHIDLNDIDIHLLAEHAAYLQNIHRLSSNRMAQNSSIGNAIMRELCVEFSAGYPNLIKKNGTPITYPTVIISHNKKTKDISLFANEYIYNFCLDYLKKIDDEPMTKVVPVAGGDETNIANVLHAIEQSTYRLLNGEKLLTWTSLSKKHWGEYGFNRRIIDHHTCLIANGSEMQNAVEALFPTQFEISATLFVISYDTGWIDTARNINIEGDWYSTDAANPKDVKSADKVNLYARRPKTDKYDEAPKGSLTSGKYGSAYWAINRILKRTERLRSFAENKIQNTAISAKERANLIAVVRNPLIYVSRSPYKETVVTSKNFREFLQNKLAPFVKSDDDLSETEKEEINAFVWKDTRDAKALKTLEDTNDVYLVQKLLGHKDLTTTFEYLRARLLKKKFYEQFAEASGIIYDEVRNDFEINTDIIRARFLVGDNLTDEQRSKLSGITVSGARCSDIENPPAEIGNLGKGPCQQQSCILCPKAVFLPKEKRALSTFAKYFASLTAKADDLAPERFKNSILEAEITALTIYKTQFFEDRLDEFDEVYDARLKLLQEIREAA